MPDPLADKFKRAIDRLHAPEPCKAGASGFLRSVRAGELPAAAPRRRTRPLSKTPASQLRDLERGESEPAAEPDPTDLEAARAVLSSEHAAPGSEAEREIAAPVERRTGTAGPGEGGALEEIGV